MSLPGGHTCETCVFFQHNRPPHDHGGQCRYDPPKLLFAKDGTRSVWPLVFLDSWCGRHSTAEAATDA